MKILAIRGKNILSLEEFAIDFQREPLCSAGLYAITGPTGAGKTAILDAMCLALYDKTPRLGAAPAAKEKGLPDAGTETLTQRDPKTLLRRGAVEGFAEVDFRGMDGANYQARWMVHRANRDPRGPTQKTKRTLRKLPDESLPGTDQKREIQDLIDSLTGLRFEEFTRSVLLAQNEFASFLKAKDDERSELLQTLTGSEIFEKISRLAHERNNVSKQELAVLEAQIAGEAPLDEAGREALASEKALLHSLLLELGKRDRDLKTELLWFTERDRLETGQIRASEDVSRANAALHAAAERRWHLERVESVQPARLVMLDMDRTAGQEKESQLALESMREAEAVAQMAAAKAASLREEAESRLDAAEVLAQRTEPLLKKAREFETEISVLEPRLANARKDLARAVEAARKARESLDGNRQNQEKTKVSLKASEEWLGAHPSHGILAGNWLLTASLLDQAADAEKELRKAGVAVARLAEKQTAQQEELKNASQAVEKARAISEKANLASARTEERARSFDLAALEEKQHALHSRRTQLESARSKWNAVLSAREQRGNAEQQREETLEKIESCNQKVQMAVAARPEAEASFMRAQELWKISYDACQEGAESLRSTLREGTPCPVCGSREHPYAAESPRLLGLLAELEKDRDTKKTHLETLTRIEEVEKKLAAGLGETLEKLDSSMAEVRRRLQKAHEDWHRLAIAGDVQGVPESSLLDWISARSEEAEAGLNAVREALKEAFAVSREADSARKRAKGFSEALEEALTRKVRAEDTLENSRRERGEVERRKQELTAALAHRLEQAGALGLMDAGGPGWKESWMSGPALFRAARVRDVDLWNEKRGESRTLARALEDLEKEEKNLEAALFGKEEAEQKERDACQALEKDVENARQKRAVLFAGSDFALLGTGAIETRLREGIRSGREFLKQQRTHAERRAEELAGKQEARTRAERSLADAKAEVSRAATQLGAWMASFNSTQGASLHPLGEAELRRLLGRGPTWIASERKALQDLESAAEAARAVLRDRSSKLAEHEATRPGSKSREDVLKEEHELSEKMQTATGKKAATEIRLLEDERCRARLVALREKLEAQRSRTSVWAQVHDLIGSHDGKKFRNLAQQMTMDVLLSYANLHLKVLAPRYRLERVKETLGLLVADQEMGDEIRSVHSLSGGESFLASLALALGLASLSSERVCVESLFIDEGFGSLDEKTLSVAMEALARLHTQGRKVGVISHLIDMTAEIPVRIEVKKMSGGRSKVVMRETGGG